MRGLFRRHRRFQIKSAAELERMRAAGLVVADTLALLRGAVAPGITTAELDALAEEAIRVRGATPSFLGYSGFPASICASVNDEIVHGIPGPRRLQAGDVVSLDCGAVLDGWHGDAAVTVPVGAVDPALVELMRVGEQALWHGLVAARVGGRLGDISAAVERHVRGQGGYGVVEEYVGHGIGTEMHQEPQVPNTGRPGRGPKLVRGMALAVEPMVTLGGRATELLDDGWTVVTADGRPAVHFEHTVALTDAGPWVLTASDGGRAGFAALTGGAFSTLPASG